MLFTFSYNFCWKKNINNIGTDRPIGEDRRRVFETSPILRRVIIYMVSFLIFLIFSIYTEVQQPIRFFVFVIKFGLHENKI